jgi:hypothetical protein
MSQARIASLALVLVVSSNFLGCRESGSAAPEAGGQQGYPVVRQPIQPGLGVVALDSLEQNAIESVLARTPSEKERDELEAFLEAGSHAPIVEHLDSVSARLIGLIYTIREERRHLSTVRAR